MPVVLLEHLLLVDLSWKVTSTWRSSIVTKRAFRLLTQGHTDCFVWLNMLLDVWKIILFTNLTQKRSKVKSCKSL